MSEVDILDDPYESLGKTGTWKKEAIEMASEVAANLEAALLIKGPLDLVISPDPPSLTTHVALETTTGTTYCRYCNEGVPAMSVGGTGDILSGLCGGLLARGMSSFDAGCIAAYITGIAGEEAFSQVGHSLSATEVLSRVRISLPQ